MNQATQDINLSRGHKEYDSKLKNVEGMLSKLDGLLDIQKYIEEYRKIKLDTKNDPSFKTKMTFDNFQMDYEEYIYDDYSKRLDKLAKQIDEEALPFYELYKLCEKINLLIKEISGENISEIISLCIRLIDSLNSLNTHDKEEKNIIIDNCYQTIYSVIMYEEIFERSDILDYIKRLNIKINIENIGRLLSKDLNKLEKVDLIDEDLKTLKTDGLGYDYLDSEIIKKISRKTVGETNSEYQEKKRKTIESLYHHIEELTYEKDSAMKEKKSNKEKLKKLYGKKYILMSKMLSILLIPVITITASSMLGKKASEKITEYKTITRTINPITGEIIGNVEEIYDENETTYVATIMVQGPWRKNSTGVGYIRTITAYEYIVPEYANETFHVSIEDLEGNLVEKYKYIESKDQLESTDSLTESTILITETYQDKSINRPSQKYVVPFAITGACLSIIADIFILLGHNRTKYILDNLNDDIIKEKLSSNQIKQRLLEIKKEAENIQIEYNNAVKKYGSLADKFVFEDIDTKWIKEYTKTLKRH